MANSVNKNLNIWINDKQVENNIKSIRSAMVTLINQQAKMTIGSDEYNKTATKIKELKGIYEEHRKSLKITTDEIEKATDKTKKWIDTAAIFGTGKIIAGVINKVISSTQQYVDAFAEMDDAMAAVRKTTGMTTEDVEKLTESLKKIDTRTATNELLKIAEEGGRLGIAKEQIESFTKAVDVANVALGDSFSGGAEEIATVLGKIRNEFKETRSSEVGDAFNRIGSAINEMGASSAASEQNLAEFAQRVGSMPEVFKPTIQQTIALGAVFEENAIDAEVASRAYGILINTAASNIGKFAKQMKITEEAARNLMNTNPAEFATKFAASLKGLSGTETSERLKELSLSADGVVKIVGALSNNTERLSQLMDISNKSFAEGTSLMNEFYVVNNNAAAKLDKAKNAVQQAKQALGKELTPVITELITLSGKGMDTIAKLSKILINNKGIVLAYASAMAALYVIRNKNIIVQKAELLIEKANNSIRNISLAIAAKRKLSLAQERAAIEAKRLEDMKSRLEMLSGSNAQRQLTYVTLQQTIAQKASVTATHAQIQANRMLKAAQMTNIWGLLITAITTAVVAIKSFIDKEKEMKKEQAQNYADLLTDMNEQKKVASDLFSQLKKTTKGTEAYKKALTKLKELYPDVINSHITEKGALDDIAAAYRDITMAIEDNVASQARQQKITDAQSSFYEAWGKKSAKIQAYFSTYTKNGKVISNALRDEMMKFTAAELESLAKDRGYISSSGVEKQFSINFEKKFGMRFLNGIMEDSRSMLAMFKEAAALGQQIERVNKTYKPFIHGSYSSTSGGYNSGAKGGDYTDNTQSGDPTDPPTTDKWEEFYKKLQNFRNNDRISQLHEWEKTKVQIEQQYDELIEEANRFGNKGKEEAAKLESEKGDAVIKAGQDYLKKYADVLKNLGGEAQKLAEKTDLSHKQSQMLTDILGSQQEWDDKISEFQNNIEIIGDIVENMDSEDENYSNFSNMLSEMIDAQCDAIRQKGEATANIVEKYAQETKEFVKSESDAITKSQMSDYDKQIAVIDERYNTEIQKVKEVIAAKQQIMKEGGDVEELKAQIDALKAQISEMEKLRIKSKSNLTKTGSSSSDNNVWEKLDKVFKMSPEEFKDNWTDNIKTVADAMQELADTVFNIFDSISKIQSNKDAAELKNYTDLQDAKSNALQQQYDQGLISEKYYNAQKEKIQAEKEKKEKAIQHKEFERNKKASIVEAIITGILAAVKSFASLGFPWGLIPMALSIATTGVQIAAIASQANPYAKGGWIKEKQLILAGEEGQEWIASNKLLTDKKTKHVINALEAYQQGNTAVLDDVLRVPVPKQKNLSQSANSISRTFADSKSEVVNNYYTNENGGSTLLKEIRQMNKYLSDPKNRQAYITRKQQLEFEEQENEIKKYARL